MKREDNMNLETVIVPQHMLPAIVQMLVGELNTLDAAHKAAQKRVDDLEFKLDRLRNENKALNAYLTSVQAILNKDENF